MRIAILVVALLLTVGLLPIEAASRERWGALFWAYVDEHYFNPHIPRSDKRYHVVASIAWNYPTKREAIVAARKGCIKEARKTGLKVPLKSIQCGDLKYDDPVAAGTVGGVIFGAGQCAAYATGPHKLPDALCPVFDTGVSLSESEAKSNALDKCNYHGKCQIKLSACNATR